jgi:translocation and assembly module TamB
LTRILAALAVLLFAIPAMAQQAGEPTPPAQDAIEAERSLFVGFVENQLSTPNRRIGISNIQGILSSNATIGEITVADREGVWLRIVNASIVWSRSALLLRRQLDISSLAADSIEVLRRPVPQEGLPAPEARSFAVPELPLAIIIESLDVPRISFGEDVFGLESELSATGRIRLEGGSLDTALEIERLDGPGGQFTLAATYDNETEIFDLDLSLSEPENGIVANLLNIEGRPPILLTLSGQGPVDGLDMALTLDAAERRVLTGTTALRRRAEGLAFSANVQGPIAELFPAQFRAFFGAETTLVTHGVVKDEGGLRLESIDLQSAALALQGTAETGPDGFLRRLALDAIVADPATDRVVLPVPGGETTVERAGLSVAFGEAAGEEWSGTLDIAGLTTEAFAARSVSLRLGGLARNIERRAERRITFAADGLVSGIVAQRADVAEALGQQITVDIAGEWEANQPVMLERAVLAGSNLSVSLAGEIADYIFRGAIALEASSVAPFSALAGRELSGGLRLDADGELAPVTGAFDLVLDGAATDLAIDHPVANGLLGGTTTIAGRLARTTGGFATDELRISNQQITLTADGTFATGAADFDFDFALADLALLSDRASGRLTATGRANGSEGLIGLTVAADVPSGSLAGKRLSEAMVAFQGMLQQGELEGQVTGSAFLDGVRIQLSSDIALAEGERRLNDLHFTAGGAQVTGNLMQTRSGLYEAALSVEAANIETAAALFLADASGAVDADLTLTTGEGRQNAALRASIDGLRTEGVAIGEGRVEVQVEDLFNVPMIQGSVDAGAVSAAGIDFARLQATAERTEGTTDFTANATLTNGAAASARGALRPAGDGYRVTLERAELTQAALSARLLEPASVLVQGQNITIDGLILDVGGGRVAVGGEIARALDLQLSITNLPLNIANTVRPDLELGGTVNGSATVSGSRDEPDIRFDLRGDGITAIALRQAGLRSLAVEATGNSLGNRLTIDAAVTSPEGLRAVMRGGVPLGDGTLALDVDVSAFPLAALNAVAPGQNLAGTITGSARVTGTLARPAADFQLSGTGISAAALASAGLSPLDLRAAGRYSDGAIGLSSANASNVQGLALSASGTVPLTGSGLSLALTGQAPLSIANRLLADRGAQVSGTVSLELTVSGSVQQPSVSGTFSTGGAEFIDPMTNVRLRNIALAGSISNDMISLRAASASLATGGAVTAAGTISISPEAAFPADLTIGLSRARYVDRDFVVATLTGSLALTGPLARDPLLSGSLTVERAEITVPERLGGGAAQIDVVHVAPPPEVVRTLQRAKVGTEGAPVPAGRPSVVRLDLSVSAPNQVFVRGRGLDVELGGQVRLTGPITSVQPVGGFDLIRGRLAILGQRIVFDEGTVTLVGDLDPFLNFVARSERSDITVFITVTGRVSDLNVSFSSQPELPEDEVLARLIFNRGIGELSPLQIAQLALAAAELAGGSDTSLLGSLRQATGLDDIDIVTTPEGGAAVRVGRYIQDNVYLGVEAGTQGNTRATINLDITQDLKAKGTLGTDGGSSVGIFYEKDY